MKDNSKFKKVLALSVFSSVFFISGTRANAVMRKTITSTVGAASSSQLRTGDRRVYVNGERIRRIRNQTNSLVGEKKFDSSKLEQGRFKNSKGEQVIFPVHSKISDEGLTLKYVKSKDEEEIIVTYIGNGFYSKTLSVEEVRKLDGEDPGYFQSGVDSLGRERLIVLFDGNYNDIAFQVNTGVWRHVNRDDEKNIYLGHQVDFSTISIDVKNLIFRDLNKILSYAAPITNFDILEKIQ